ncbi:hypothetical protein [Amycolatopsis rubida]|uniref:Uncharacterized protein n=1 Tax=Amycolatopsis rubida TaxID=112413 RepID=A0A1I5XIY3_9PSEU|nr:hypothetical protein [Amycolatopsis rubida]SFQ31914.1 hypothetical protein SAMN05421854_110267 [Amycolatopsis rubida]
MHQLTLLDPARRTITPADEPDLTDYDLLLVGMSGKDAHAALDVTLARARAAGVGDRVWTVHADLGLMEAPRRVFRGPLLPEQPGTGRRAGRRLRPAPRPAHRDPSHRPRRRTLARADLARNGRDDRQVPGRGPSLVPAT